MSPELREQYLQNDLAALDAMVQICLRAAHAAVTRIEELTARAPGWTDPREVDCTLPADRMARAIRRCAALKAKLPDLYNKPDKTPAASAPASAQPAPTEQAPTEPARQRDPDAATDPYENLSDPAERENLEDDAPTPSPRAPHADPGSPLSPEHPSLAAAAPLAEAQARRPAPHTTATLATLIPTLRAELLRKDTEGANRAIAAGQADAAAYRTPHTDHECPVRGAHPAVTDEQADQPLRRDKREMPEPRPRDIIAALGTGPPI